MGFSFVINRISKYIVILILVIFFIFAIFWLWQRQPQPKTAQIPQEATTAVESKEVEETFKIIPKDWQVLTETEVTLEGKTTPEDFIAIFSNNSANVTKADKSGNFSQKLSLAKGLNLLEVVAISPQLKENQRKSQGYFVDENLQNGSLVYIGSVKSIFDTLLTIITPTGERSIRTSQSTKIELPPPPPGAEEETGPAIKKIRVGDYLTAQGDPSSEKSQDLNAKSIEVARENKPQNARKLADAKILTGVSKNLFSAKSLVDNSILEFTLIKTSQLQKDGKEAKAADIEKNKNAIIIHHPEAEKNIIDLIYLLPS